MSQVPSDDAGDETKAAFIDSILEKAPNLMLKPDFENPEQSTEFFRTLGAPDDSAGYEAVKYEDLSFDEARESALRDIAFNAKLTKSQFKQVSEQMLKFDHTAKLEAETATSEAMQALRGEWGMAFDERKTLAEKVRSTFFDFIPEAQMDAKTIKALHTVGVQLGNENGTQGDHRSDNNTNSVTPADALARIDDIMNNREHPYWISAHPGHNDALRQMIELRTQADPNASTTLASAGFSA
jgi:hypothetical protein